MVTCRIVAVLGISTAPLPEGYHKMNEEGKKEADEAYKKSELERREKLLEKRVQQWDKKKFEEDGDEDIGGETVTTDSDTSEDLGFEPFKGVYDDTDFEIEKEVLQLASASFLGDDPFFASGLTSRAALDSLLKTRANMYSTTFNINRDDPKLIYYIR
jgi:hypothetical protein